MSNISREIYQYIRYIGRNILTDYFFLSKHPSANTQNEWRLGELHMPSGVTSNWYFLSGRFVKTDTNHYLFSNTWTWKINITGYLPSLSVCHKNLRFCWKLLWTIMYSLELEKLIIIFFRKKMKNVNLLQPIYIKKYIYIHRYKRNILIFSLYRYIVAVPRYPPNNSLVLAFIKAKILV